MSGYRIDPAALAATPTRVLIAVGQEVTVFPSHHTGFMEGEFNYAGQTEAFGAQLREVLGSD